MRALSVLLVFLVGCGGSQERAPTRTGTNPAPTLALLPRPMPARYLRTLAFDPSGYAPDRASAASDLLLGDLIFHSPRVLGSRARALGMSCHSCHPNGATNATLRISGISDRPGNVDLASSFFRPGADDGLDLPVNIPSLRGARFTAPYGHDGRTASLAEFVAGVVGGEFDGEPLSPRRLSALVRYVDDLDFLPNPLLREDGRLASGAPEPARRGEVLFDRACATCHVPSTFFRDGKVHRIGSAKKPSAAALTDGFETPTLLGLEETAPYFHDGSLRTLRDVVDWFASHDGLPWNDGERNDVTAYLEAVGHVETRFDDRPPAREKAEALACLLLLREGEGAEDAWVWDLVLDRAASELDATTPTPATASRFAAARREIADLAAERARGVPPKELRARAAPLHERLVRLAADWAGTAATANTPR